MENNTEFRKFLEKSIKDSEKKLEEMKTLLASIDNGAPAPVKKTRAKKVPSDDEAPKAEAPKKKAPEAKKETRIPRMTPALKKKLETEMTRQGVVVDDAFYGEYRKHINEMSEEDYNNHENKDDHMVDYVSTKVKGSNAAGGGPASPEVKKVSELKGLEEVGTGIFKNKSGKLVTGPTEDVDEDMEDAKFDGEEYILGTKTKRVYKADPSGGPDVFCGFWGIGKFAGADD